MSVLASAFGGESGEGRVGGDLAPGGSRDQIMTEEDLVARRGRVEIRIHTPI